MKLFLTALVLPILAGAAILPDTIGPYHRTATGQPTLTDSALWDEYGLKNFESGPLLPGIKINTSPTDFYPIEQLQLMKFEGESWKLFGPIMSSED